MALDGAHARAAAGARHLDEEQLVRHAPGPPAHGRDGGGEERDDRRADRRGEVRRARVADHDAAGAGEHLGELGERRPAAEVGDLRRVASPPPGARSASSPGPPVTTTRRPAATSASTSAALRSGAQARAGTEAPGCTTT